MAITFFNSAAKKPARLAVRPYSASNSHPQERVTRPEGVKIFHQILLVLEGGGVVHAHGKSYKLKRGSAFFTSKERIYK